MQYLEGVDTASSQPGDLVLPLRAGEQSRDDVAAAPLPQGLAAALVQELWSSAEAETCDLTVEEFGVALAAVGAKFNYGVPPGAHPDAAEKIAFLRGLRLNELMRSWS
jgi:hypothetical protein